MKKFDIYEHPFFGREVVKKGFIWPAFFFSFIWAYLKGMRSVAGSLIPAMLLLAGAPAILLSVVLFVAGQEEVMLTVPLYLTVSYGPVWFGLSLLTGFYASKWRGYHLRDEGYKLVKTVPENPDNLVTRKASMGIPTRELPFRLYLRHIKGCDQKFEFKGYSRDKHDGQKREHWVCRFANGDEEEGPYKDGKKHGRWFFRFTNGDVSFGPMVNDDMHGLWVHRLANGGMQIGPYESGKKHGYWVEQTEDVFRGGRLTTFFDRLAALFAEPGYRAANSDVFEGQYKNGREHGHWVLWAANGSSGIFVEQDDRLAPGILRSPDGDMAEGSYKDGKAHGLWIFRYADGRVKKVIYTNGEMVDSLDDTSEAASAGGYTDAGNSISKI